MFAIKTVVHSPTDWFTMRRSLGLVLTSIRHALQPKSLVRQCSSSKYIIKSPYTDVTLPRCTLHEFIWENLTDWPEKVAVECGVTGRMLTYAQMRQMCLQLGSGLLKLGLKPGDIVSIILPNVPAFPVVLLGSIEAGLIVSPVNPMYTGKELAHHLNGASCIVTHPLFLPNILSVRKSLKKDLILVALDESLPHGLPAGVISFKDLLGLSTDLTNVSKVSQNLKPDDTCFLPYSSGTSGLPKGVCLSHQNLSVNLNQVDHPEMAQLDNASGETQDVVPGVLPFFHIYGTTLVLLQTLMKGGKLITLPRFEPETFLKVLKANKDVVMHVVPPLLFFLASHPAVSLDHLSRIKSILCGGAPCSTLDIERVQERKHIPILQAYGMTEASPALTGPPINSTDKASIGCPVSLTEAKVINQSGMTLPPGEIGEMCFRGPQIMRGYCNNPEATAEIIDSEGWLHTGDLGYYNEKSYFYAFERLKELIKVKGFQVPPAELEAVLRSHPKVSDAGVIGLPCPRQGEQPVAFVVPRESTGKLNNDDLIQFVSDRVAPYKQIKKIIFTDSIPKSAAGKILRRQLKEMAAHSS